jgi:hypothetical protein
MIAASRKQGRPGKGVETSAVLVRFPVDLLARIDAYKARLERQVGGVSIPRTEVILRLCDCALDTLGATKRQPDAPPRGEIPQPSSQPRVPGSAEVSTPAPQRTEIPDWLERIIDLREQYPRLTLRDFAQLLFERGIRTRHDTAHNSGTLKRWLERAGMH